MSIYETIKKTDGTLELLPDQIKALKEKDYSSEQIFSGLLKLYDFYRLSESSTSPAKDDSCLAPCVCGSVDFIPTGNCHVCAVCGESQGCS